MYRGEFGGGSSEVKTTRSIRYSGGTLVDFSSW